MGKRFQRVDGETMAQFQARIAAVQAAERPAPIAPKRRRRARVCTADKRNADRIDGFDRDDIGASPDF